MNSYPNNKNKINLIEDNEDSSPTNQKKKNLTASTNKHNNLNINSSNSNNSSNKNNKNINNNNINNNNINNNNINDNNINQVNSFKKNKKKKDKKKDNQQNNNNFNNSNKSNPYIHNNNNIKHLNNNFNNNINNNQINFNSNKQKEPSNQQRLEDANYQMQQMNYSQAEKIYKIIYENCSNYSNQFLINLLNNYALCLYHQRKFEEATEIATKIILEYDNKNKRAYLTVLYVLYSIKEYKKAGELIEKINTIFKKPKDFEMFKGIVNDINNAINEEEDNKQRDIYYQREKKIIDLVHNQWIHLGMCSLGTFIGGCLLYKLISK